VKLNRVTVTGADDSVQPEVLHRVQAQYPFVEWGILVSGASKGRGRARFPSDDWLKQLIDLYDRVVYPPTISVHVCGQWVRDLCAGNWEWLYQNNRIGALFFRASRVQLNFHSYAHKVVMPDFTDALRGVKWQVILQSDGVNDELIRQVKDTHPDMVGVLHDRSGGAGILPRQWPKPLKGMYNGYAGGLSAANVVEQLRALEEVVGDETVWIDAETRLRNHTNTQLMIPLVEEYLEAAEPWVRP